MSKKLKMNGRKLKNLSDPNLAHSHEKGATVTFMQTAVDVKWGRYMFAHYKRFGLILNKSLNYYRITIRKLEECRKITVDEKTGIRDVPEKLRDSLEINSIQFIILTKIGLEHLYIEYKLAIEQIKKHRNEPYTSPSDNEDIVEKLKSLQNAIGMIHEVPQQLHLILNRRDIIEHPQQGYLYDCSEVGWKNVHLSWILSGEVEGIAKPIIDFVNELVVKLEQYVSENPIPGTLTGLTRGLKAGEQYKKYN